MAEYIAKEQASLQLTGIFPEDMSLEKYIGLVNTRMNKLFPADVIERAEYDELHEKYLKAIHNHTECLKELHEYRSKIDKAIEEIEGEYSTCNQDWIDGLNRALDILKRNIGE